MAELALRLPGLMALPIFCDESIYLRYAQLVRRDPIGNAFASLVDPKPPLHSWLLACVFGLTRDPLVAGRFLSVVAGLASILVVIPLCRELGDLRPASESASSAGGPNAFTLAACGLFLTCPFLAFYQRMALAESLLVLGSLCVAWLGLRLVRTRSGSGLLLGVAMGLTLLTKQILSYPLLALPITALALRWKDLDRPSRASAVRRLAGAFALAFLLFSPVVFIDRGPDLRERILFHASHGLLAGSWIAHARLFWDNVRYVFVPMILCQPRPGILYEGFQPPADAGWFWIYLTPPVYLLSLAGLARLALSREIRLFSYLGVWTLAALAPFIPFSTTAVSRYVLLAAAPLLLAAASLIGAVCRRASARSRPVALTALLLASLAWPLRVIALQDSDALRQPLARSDRWQYVSGWPAGGASRQAVEAIARMSRRGPVVVVTSHMSGTPNDVVWVYLDGKPNVHLYFVDWAFRSPILVARGQPNTFELRSGFHEAHSASQLVTVASGVPILFVGMDPYPSPRSGIPAERAVARFNPGMKEIARFENPPMPPPAHPEAVVIDRLR